MRTLTTTDGRNDLMTTEDIKKQINHYRYRRAELEDEMVDLEKKDGWACHPEQTQWTQDKLDAVNTILRNLNEDLEICLANSQ